MAVAEQIKWKKLGELLIEARLINEEQLDYALEVSRQNGSKLGKTLLEMRLITPKQLAIFTGLQWSVPYVNLEKQPISAAALELIPEPVARNFGAIPISVLDGTVTVAMEDPGNLHAIESLQTLTRKRVLPVQAVARDVQEAITASGFNPPTA